MKVAGFALFVVLSVVADAKKQTRIKLRRKSGVLDQRIIGGTIAEASDWPFIVYMNFHQPKPLWKTCGGALVSSKYVVTAAHCVEDIPNSPEFITIGARRVNRISGRTPGQNVSVTKIYVPGKFLLPNEIVDGKFSFDYDIAVLKLSAEVSGAGIPVKLPSANEDISSQSKLNCKSAGWGSTQEFPSVKAQNTNKYELSDQLMEMQVSIVNKAKCIKDDNLKRSHYFGKDLARTICAGEKGKKQQPTVCVGDSGSPMVCKNSNNEDVLQGVMVAGTKLCIPGGSHIFLSEVSKYRNWIDSIINEDNSNI